jgi:transcriptional regulator with XRE-family HTH domain
MPRTSQSAAAAQRLGWEIRQTRLKLEVSQAELARRLGVSASYIWAVESGSVNLTVGQLNNFAGALDVGLAITFPIPIREAIQLPATVP